MLGCPKLVRARRERRDMVSDRVAAARSAASTGADVQGPRPGRQAAAVAEDSPAASNRGLTLAQSQSRYFAQP